MTITGKDQQLVDVFFILAIITAVIAAIVYVVGRWANDGAYKAAAGVALVLAAVFLFLSSFVIIQTRHEGIAVSFGKPGQTLRNGWHWKNPTTKVKKYDGTLQTKTYGASKNDAGDPFTVQLGNSDTATLDVTYQYRLGANISAIYRDYPTADTGDLNDRIVSREVQQQLNIVYARFDPTASLRATSQQLIDQTNGKTVPVGNVVNGADTYQAYAAQALPALRSMLTPQGVDFVSITVGGISYSPRTRDQLQQLQGAIVQTQIAIQNEATAKAQAAANKTLSAQPPTALQVQQECVESTSKNPSAYPPGWNCFTGGSTLVSGAR